MLLLCVAMCFLYCKKPFNPEVKLSGGGNLVVEGLINEQGVTTIKLSRTVSLKDTTTLKPEPGASITIETDQQAHFTLNGDGKGTYTSAQLTLPAAPKYRLHIITADSKEYASDYVPMKTTPVVDSITYTPQGSGLQDGNGVQVFVSTHDVTNATRYYRWDYQETWEYHSAVNSLLQYANHQVTAINPDSNRYYCYHFYTPANGIYVGSSSALKQDVITHQPVNFARASTGRLAILYSVLINEYALTEEAFTYWQNLKKNTEQLGSIFDAQPSTLTGNIHCLSDRAEAVLGYISASSVTSKRLFISGADLPFYVSAEPSNCAVGAIRFDPTATYPARAEKVFLSGDTIPVELIQPRGSPPLGYTYAPKYCVDCRLAGGTNVKPSYWP